MTLLRYPLARSAEFSGKISQLRESIPYWQNGLGVVDVDTRTKLQRSQCGRIHIDQPQQRVIGHQMPSAFLAVLPLTRQRLLEHADPDDPRYKSAAVIADAVLSGQTPDPTAGATHFLNPTIVRERRGGELPSWARGEGLPIGNQTFYFPEEGGASRQAGLTIVDPRFMVTPRGDQ